MKRLQRMEEIVKNEQKSSNSRVYRSIDYLYPCYIIMKIHNFSGQHLAHLTNTKLKITSTIFQNDGTRFGMLFWFLLWVYLFFVIF